MKGKNVAPMCRALLVAWLRLRNYDLLLRAPVFCWSIE